MLTGKGTEASHQEPALHCQPCEQTTLEADLEADLPAPVKPSDNRSPLTNLESNFLTENTCLMWFSDNCYVATDT